MGHFSDSFTQEVSLEHPLFNRSQTQSYMTTTELSYIYCDYQTIRVNLWGLELQ